MRAQSGRTLLRNRGSSVRGAPDNSVRTSPLCADGLIEHDEWRRPLAQDHQTHSRMTRSQLAILSHLLPSADLAEGLSQHPVARDVHHRARSSPGVHILFLFEDLTPRVLVLKSFPPNCPVFYSTLSKRLSDSSRPRKAAG